MRAQRTMRRAWMLGLLALAFSAAGSAPAQASALDDAKNGGQLGERYDGYLGVVQTSDANTAMANDINAKRKAHYAKIAAKNGSAVVATAGIAGTKLVKNAPAGQYVMPDADSGWQRVP